MTVAACCPRCLRAMVYDEAHDVFACRICGILVTPEYFAACIFGRPVPA